MELVAIVEGQTEESFVKNVLKPYFAELGFWIKPELIKTSKEGRGGAVTWARFSRQLINSMKQRPDARFTSMIDLYKLDTDFPHASTRRVKDIELGMLQSLPDDLRWRFVPYIQLHEFEALVFAGLRELLPLANVEEAEIAALEREVVGFGSPEEIDEGPETAPSKRLRRRLGKRYQKTTHGIQATQAFGLERLRERCPHFAGWIAKLEGLAK